ncbi:hypothetical protein SERLA73DRAFT_176623 [Serpula lacrymans var. lacrymans S7.3]|uniref:Uncharacterized protein n=1 Tax=Serpula lacrymans var. lacrymans (strain S7.3) TaxID=936435 RepID=F8PNC2_SERL3|nr:hypothetical protein SERLA73DRAFT_176623 [Serpula lacrymans var. lacrymans S7.3]
MCITAFLTLKNLDCRSHRGCPYQSSSNLHSSAFYLVREGHLCIHEYSQPGMHNMLLLSITAKHSVWGTVYLCCLLSDDSR